METTYACNTFNHRQACDREETRRMFQAAQRLLRQGRGYFVRRAAIASLREADDHALWDIGIVRLQIDAAVDGLITPSDQARTQ
jgi:uncharacterized protein YjiS (DUF1127 family)